MTNGKITLRTPPEKGSKLSSGSYVPAFRESRGTDEQPDRLAAKSRSGVR